MNQDYEMTTGKKFKGKAFACTSCGKRYHDNEDKKCPACGSCDRELFQQTTAKLSQPKEGDK